MTETPRPSAAVIDLVARRRHHERVVADLAAAPVQHVPAALLEALLGSWGTPEELGVTPTPDRHLRVVAG